MPIFRNQGSRWSMHDAELFGRYVCLKLQFSFFFLYLIKESRVIVYCCNEEAVSLDPNAALFINKRRSNRQGSETVTGVTKARQNQQQGQCKRRGRRQTERISNGRQGQKAGSKRSELYRQSR